MIQIDVEIQVEIKYTAEITKYKSARHDREIEDCYSLSQYCELVSGRSSIQKRLWKDVRIKNYMYTGVNVSVVKGTALNSLIIIQQFSLKNNNGNYYKVPSNYRNTRKKGALYGL